MNWQEQEKKNEEVVKKFIEKAVDLKYKLTYGKYKIGRQSGKPNGRVFLKKTGVRLEFNKSSEIAKIFIRQETGGYKREEDLRIFMWGGGWSNPTIVYKIKDWKKSLDITPKTKDPNYIPKSRPKAESRQFKENPKRDKDDTYGEWWKGSPTLVEMQDGSIISHVCINGEVIENKFEHPDYESNDSSHWENTDFIPDVQCLATFKDGVLVEGLEDPDSEPIIIINCDGAARCIAVQPDVKEYWEVSRTYKYKENYSDGKYEYNFVVDSKKDILNEVARDTIRIGVHRYLEDLNKEMEKEK